MIKSMRFEERCSVTFLQNFGSHNGNLVFFFCGAGGGGVTNLSDLPPRSSSLKTKSMRCFMAGGESHLLPVFCPVFYIWELFLPHAHREEGFQP